MEAVVQKSLVAPLKKLSSCVSGAPEEDVWTKHRAKQGSKVSRTRDSALLRAYQADLDRERKLREAMNARKNAERAAMRAHFRRKYQIPQSAKDSSHLQAVGGKVVLPRELAKMVRSDRQPSDESSTLLSAFQSLSFDKGLISGRKQSSTADHSGQCKVM